MCLNGGDKDDFLLVVSRKEKMEEVFYICGFAFMAFIMIEFIVCTIKDLKYKKSIKLDNKRKEEREKINKDLDTEIRIKEIEDKLEDIENQYQYKTIKKTINNGHIVEETIDKKVIDLMDLNDKVNELSHDVTNMMCDLERLKQYVMKN